MNDIEMTSRKLLEDAFELNASDIHFTPRRKDLLIEIRVNHNLYEVDIFEPHFADKLISHFKFLAGMDIGERRRPQNGAMDVRLNQSLVHLRLSTLPTPFNESLVIRLLPQTQDIRMSDLSVFPESTSHLLSLLNYENGLILLSGPTGSGKTTTLYALLSAAKRRYNSRIVTLEDPVEKKTDSFVQMEVNEKASLSYAEGFKAILRHDPDIIMVGEIRDSETAKIAVRAALTGHLVLSTVHAFDSVSTIQRLIELGIPKFDLKETLVGVVAQRLVTVVCPTCGPVCKRDCPNKGSSHRTGIFEILAGMSLHEVLTNGKRKPRAGYKKIEDFMRQGISLGQLNPSNKVDNQGNTDVF